MQTPYSISLFGSFEIRGPRGQNLTPRGKKARAMMALLAQTKQMRRSRRWIEAMLWSDRNPTQASGSLRQTLREVRTALGEHDSIVGSDRQDIWLEADVIITDLDPSSPNRESGREFLEGLDLRDDAFNEWLTQCRATFSGQHDKVAAMPATSGAITIRSAMSEVGSVSENVVSNIIADTVARGLEENFTAFRYVTPGRVNGQAADLEIRCDAAQDGSRSVVFVRIEEGQGGRVLFSDHRSISGDPSELLRPEVVGGLVNATTSYIPMRLLNHIDLKRPEASALGYSNLGLRSLSRFDSGGFDTAYQHFSDASDMDDNGIYVAWKAFVRMAQIVEGVEGDKDAWRDEIAELTAHTLERCRGNGLAVALVALTRFMIEDDLQIPADLAEEAMMLNPSNIFARQTLALAHSAVGNVELAYQLSSDCRPIASDGPLSHLWDLYHALVCISAGRVNEARDAAKRAALSSPHFVAPRRQMVALCAHNGDLDEARTHLQALETLEPGFSLDRYLNDPKYPVLTLRNAGLLSGLRSEV